MHEGSCMAYRYQIFSPADTPYASLTLKAVKFRLALYRVMLRQSLHVTGSQANAVSHVPGRGQSNNMCTVCEPTVVTLPGQRCSACSWHELPVQVISQTPGPICRLTLHQSCWQPLGLSWVMKAHCRLHLHTQSSV